ncbi:MAG: hypothetical protein IPK83_17705 [Planctomycetes bacterium]|nr:hypothetical protein [Planctomycetota bacterium]
MELQRNNMDSLLAMLGEAHQSGAFASGASRFPWHAQTVVAQSRNPRRHPWVWVGAPLAAAAAVAVLFVGPSLFSGRTTPNFAQNVPVELRSDEPELVADAAAATTLAVVDCDFNGDGLIDGQDIQAYADLRQKVAGDPAASAELLRKGEQLQRCMLEGGS